MTTNYFSRRAWFVIFLALVIFYLYGLGHFPLMGPDEPRYAQVAREMFLRGDLITPSLGGYNWFEKPSLLYWLMMGAYELFGFSEFAARLGPAIAGLLTAWFVYWMARRVELKDADGRPIHGWGQWSCLAFATSAGAMIFSRGASFDIILTATVTAAVAFFFAADNESDNVKQRRFLAGFYVSVGLSLLAKGLLGIVLPGGIVFLYFLFQRRVPERRMWLSLLWGAPLGLAVAAIWYGPVIARHRWEFIHDFIIEHHFARYTSNKYLHPQPFWFFLPVILGLALPWTPMLIDAFVGLRKLKWRQPTDAATRLQFLGLALLVFPVLFFSLSGSKLPGYVLPGLPGAAILIGVRVAHFVETGVSRRALQFTGLLLVLLALGGGVYIYSRDLVELNCLIAVFLPLVIAGCLAIWFVRQRRSVGAGAIPLAMVLAGIVAINCLAGPLLGSGSVRDLLKTAAARGYGNAPIVDLHTVEHSAEFYAPVFAPPNIGDRLHRDPDGKQTRFEGVAPITEITRMLGRPVLVIVPREYVGQLTDATALQSEILGNNGKVSLVVVRIRNTGAP
ncbi:MAG: glycosyltransferase family 39 protein [Pyrinomonadaceae bacterium]